MAQAADLNETDYVLIVFEKVVRNRLSYFEIVIEKQCIPYLNSG